MACSTSNVIRRASGSQALELMVVVCAPPAVAQVMLSSQACPHSGVPDDGELMKRCLPTLT